ncbi:MAG: hypothetical protein II670_00825 [Alphaproteobacteria bacterium]|jgi:hypothetical protein|nr:hypothetical protein [Alphaproteobacteria bacterium]
MAWVAQRRKIEVGDRVVTTRTHRHPCGIGYFEKGTEVKVTAIDDMRGYSIEDDDGHSIAEVGWVI